MSTLRGGNRLTHKIAAIGAVGVLGILTVGSIYLIGAENQDGYRQPTDGSRATYALANGLYIKLLESRRAEKDFLLRSDMKYVERHKELDKSIRDEIDTLRRQAGGAGDLVTSIDNIRKGFEAYAVH